MLHSYVGLIVPPKTRANYQLCKCIQQTLAPTTRDRFLSQASVRMSITNANEEKHFRTDRLHVLQTAAEDALNHGTESRSKAQLATTFLKTYPIPTTNSERLTNRCYSEASGSSSRTHTSRSMYRHSGIRVLLACIMQPRSQVQSSGCCWRLLSVPWSCPTPTRRNRRTHSIHGARAGFMVVAECDEHPKMPIGIGEELSYFRVQNHAMHIKVRVACTSGCNPPE